MILLLNSEVYTLIAFTKNKKNKIVYYKVDYHNGSSLFESFKWDISNEFTVCFKPLIDTHNFDWNDSNENVIINNNLFKLI